jgi:glutamate dehydrogenase (NADP+)
LSVTAQRRSAEISPVTSVETQNGATDILSGALTRLEAAACHVTIDPDVLEKLRFPKETLSARLMIRMDDGSRRSFLAWRCRYDDTRGPTKGGIRFHPEASMDEVQTLAFWMMCKCAVTNLPFGGGKGAVRVDPHALSKAELERLSRAYVHAFAGMIGPDRDIPAPDVYTNAMIMGWMADEYSSLVGAPSPAVITGKPITLGGSLGRDDATSLGGYYVLNVLARELGIQGKQRIAIQGFGNAGWHIARLLHADGHKIVAISDSRGAISHPDGLDPAKVLEAKNRGGSVTAYADDGQAKRIDPETLIATDCDILVPAALENTITRHNAGSVRARIILELANGPVTPSGDKILRDKKIIVLPDILANAGGVTVSYFEWVQNRQGYYWSLDEVQRKLRGLMECEARGIWQISQSKGIDVRTAAYVVALDRLAKAIEAHGTQSYFAG